MHPYLFFQIWSCHAHFMKKKPKNHPLTLGILSLSSFCTHSLCHKNWNTNLTTIINQRNVLPWVFLVELVFCWMVWLVGRLHFELSLLAAWPKTFVILFFNTIGNMYLGIPIATQNCIICATAFLFKQQSVLFSVSLT